MQFYCSEQMQNRELNTCKQDIYSFLHFLLPTNTEPILKGPFPARSAGVRRTRFGAEHRGRHPAGATAPCLLRDHGPPPAHAPQQRRAVRFRAEDRSPEIQLPDRRRRQQTALQFGDRGAQLHGVPRMGTRAGLHLGRGKQPHPLPAAHRPGPADRGTAHSAAHPAPRGESETRKKTIRQREPSGVLSLFREDLLFRHSFRIFGV